MAATPRPEIACPGGCGKFVPAAELVVLGEPFPFVIQCDECFAREEAEAHEKLVHDLLAVSRVPLRMRGWSLATYPRDRSSHEPLERALRWLDGYRGGERRNLFLFGRVGTGKTGLAWGILRALIEEGTPGLLIPLRDLLWELRRSFSTGAPCDTSARAQRVPVLVLDDLGAERPTDYARDELAVIVERRYGAERPTIVTSNYDPDAIAERLGHDDPVIGERIVSRLTDGAMQIRIGGPDRRTP
jgi:DNA replication protein DnaC